MSHEIVKSDCKRLSMKSCSNIQHLMNTRFINAAQVKIVRCDVQIETFKLFGGETLNNLKINYCYSFDDDQLKYLTTDSPFMHLQRLDLGYNRLTF
jgi:hypothetical protein